VSRCGQTIQRDSIGIKLSVLAFGRGHQEYRLDFVVLLGLRLTVSEERPLSLFPGVLFCVARLVLRISSIALKGFPMEKRL
jgi:hypothetical protein